MASGSTDRKDNVIDHASQLPNVPQDSRQEQDRSENCTLQEEITPQSLRITVLGRTGEGKSSTLNTILGRPAFKVDNSPISVTNSSTYASCIYNGRLITVMDTPGIHSNIHANSTIMKELKRTAFLLPEGVHCFIICMNMSDCRFNKETEETLETIKIFGENVFNYCMLAYTKAETELNHGSLEDFLKRMKTHDQYRDFLHQVNDHVVPVNNITQVKEQQEQNRQNIIEMVEKVVRENKKSKRPGVYTNKLFKKAKRLHDELPDDILHQAIANAVVEVVSTTFPRKITLNILASEVIKNLQDSDLCGITDAEFTFSNDGDSTTFDYQKCRDHIVKICGIARKSIFWSYLDVLIGLVGFGLVFSSIICSVYRGFKGG